MVINRDDLQNNYKTFGDIDQPVDIGSLSTTRFDGAFTTSKFMRLMYVAVKSIAFEQDLLRASLLP